MSNQSNQSNQKHEVKHFLLTEFRCPCCGRSDTAATLVFWLDVLRRAVGRPVKVNSGFRCERRNVQVGGASSSRHLIGCAADLATPAGVRYDDFVGFARRFAGEGWEIVTYDSGTYFHLAVPRDQRSVLWDGRRVIALNFTE